MGPDKNRIKQDSQRTYAACTKEKAQKVNAHATWNYQRPNMENKKEKPLQTTYPF